MCQGPPERVAWAPEPPPGGEPPAKKHPYHFHEDEKEASAYLMLQICGGSQPGKLTKAFSKRLFSCPPAPPLCDAEGKLHGSK